MSVELGTGAELRVSGDTEALVEVFFWPSSFELPC